MDKFTYFWCLIIVSLTIFLIGAYKNIFLKIYYIVWINKKTKEEENLKHDSASRVRLPYISTVVSEGVLQSRIKNRSIFLWIRHFLIFSGFMCLFILDCLNTVLGHYLHHYFHYEYFVSGGGRSLLKFGMELSGAVLFAGLTLGLIHRIVFAEQEKKLIDLQLLVLLWMVVLSGFLAESFRLAATPTDPFVSFSFIGGPLAGILSALPFEWGKQAEIMWVVHATITIVFFSYIPFSKLVHMFVAPLGRSITQGGDYGQLKRERITEGLL